MSYRIIKNLEELVSRHFLGWIISLEGDIRIVSPDEVVEQTKNMITQLADQYL